MMKIFDAKTIATSYLSNLIATRLLSYAKKANFTPKNVYCLNLSGYHQAKLKMIFTKSPITDVSFSNLKQTHFPYSTDSMNVFIANLSFARSPELISFFHEADRLLRDDDILLIAVNEESEGHVRDSLENVDLNFISFKEKINIETTTYIFFASRDELTNFLYAMEPAIEDYTESDKSEEKDLESPEANDEIFNDLDDDEDICDETEAKTDQEASTDLEEESESESDSDINLEVEDEADPEGEGELDEESETDHESDSDQDADGDWEQDEVVDADPESDTDEESEHEGDAEFDDDSDPDDEEDDELDDDLDDDEDLDEEEDEDLDDEDELDETEELDDDEGELDGDGEPEKDDAEHIVEEDKKADADQDNDDEEENTKSFRR